MNYAHNNEMKNHASGQSLNGTIADPLNLCWAKFFNNLDCDDDSLCLSFFLSCFNDFLCSRSTNDFEQEVYYSLALLMG